MDSAGVPLREQEGIVDLLDVDAAVLPASTLLAISRIASNLPPADRTIATMIDHCAKSSSLLEHALAPAGRVVEHDIWAKARHLHEPSSSQRR